MQKILPAPVTHKRCTKCDRLKPLDEFYFKNKRTGTRVSWCKRCLSQHTSSQAKASPKRWAERQAAWRKANPENLASVAEKRSASRNDFTREKERAYDATRREKKKAYRIANAEKIRTRNAEYRRKYAAKLAMYNATYYRANKKAVDARIAKAIAKNPDLYHQLHKAAKHRRKVRLTNQGPSETFTDREIYERDGWHCKLCGKSVNRKLVYPDPGSASLDHVIPIAKGGGHTRANCQLAHLRCNVRKKDRLISLF